jgi:hypothetical protein
MPNGSRCNVDKSILNDATEVLFLSPSLCFIV